MTRLSQLLLLLCLLILIGSAFTLQAQTFTISGKVADPNSTEPLIGVSVALLQARDSTPVTGASTDVDGNFQITNVANGFYKLRITYIGYQKLDRMVRVTGQDVPLGTLELEQTSTVLRDVTVEGTQIRAQQKGDTTEFNAGAFKTNRDATAEELVQKMPGVTVENGAVKAQGEDVKRVTIDGREFFGDDATMALRNLPAEVIDKIQVFDRQSDQAQFTGFNDGNTEKALNIVTRGGVLKGQFGKLYAGYGTEERYATGGNFNIFDGDTRISIVGLSNNINQQNFSSQDLLGVTAASSNQRGGFQGGGGGGGPRGGGGGGAQGGRPGGFDGGAAGNFLVGQQGGINATNSLGLNYSDNWGKKIKVSSSYFFNNSNNTSDSRLQREYFLSEGVNQFYNENNNAESHNYNHRFSARLEYTIDSSNSIILTPRLSFQDNNSKSLLSGINSLANNDLLNKTENNRNSNNNGYNLNNEILWRHRFNKNGRTFSFSLNTSFNDRTGVTDQVSKSEFYTFNIDSTQLIDQRSNTASDGYTASPNLTYTEPLGKNGQLSFTYNPSYNKSNSERLTNRFDETTNAYSQVDSVLSNRFDNETTTQRGGAGYRFRLANNSNFNIGVNYQNVQLNSNQTFPRELSVRKSFDNLLPTAMLDLRPSRNQNLRIFYRTFTQTPSINQLQNVIDNSNPLLLSVGNANLQQQYTHSVSTRYNSTNPQRGTTFFGVLSANFVNNYITNATLIAARDTLLQEDVTLYRGAQLSQPVNLNGYWNFRSFFTYGVPVKMLKSNLNVNAGFTYTLSPGLINNAKNEANTYNVNGGLVLSSNISEKLDFTVAYSANYNIVENTLQPELNNNYYYQNTSARFNWLPWKSLVLNTDLTHTLYTGLGADFNQNFLLWNAAIGYKFLKNKVGEVRLTAFDLLKQNNSFTRTVTESYVEDNVTNVLTQYFMLTFTYNIRNFTGVLGGNNEQRNPGMPGFPRQ